MLIEYRIKFEKDGLTIAQHIEPAAANTASVTANGKQQVNGLPATQKEVESAASTNPLAKTAAGGGPIFDTGGGPIFDTGGGPIFDTGGVPVAAASAPIFILGPIIFTTGASPELGKPIEPSVTDTTPKSLSAAAGE